MVEITKETWEENDIKVIVFNGKKWLNEKHIEEQLRHSNLPAVNQNILQSLEKHFAKKIIMDCRTTPAVNFNDRLGFSQHVPILTQ